MFFLFTYTLFLDLIFWLVFNIWLKLTLVRCDRDFKTFSDVILWTPHSLVYGVPPDRSNDPFKESNVLRSSVFESEKRSERSEQELRDHLLEYLVGHVSQLTKIRRKKFDFDFNFNVWIAFDHFVVDPITILNQCVDKWNSNLS